MNPLEQASARLKNTANQFYACQRGLQLLIATTSDTGPAQAALSELPRTFAFRLLAEFEGILTELGPRLSPPPGALPLVFTSEDGLAKKMAAIGKRTGMPKDIRALFDSELRQKRNELLHGEDTPAEFEPLLAAVKLFLDQCAGA
ncbi:hypothetical protein MCEMSE15_01982 [Fimbriimonadaceae bacterium]